MRTANAIIWYTGWEAVARACSYLCERNDNASNADFTWAKTCAHVFGMIIHTCTCILAIRTHRSSSSHPPSLPSHYQCNSFLEPISPACVSTPRSELLMEVPYACACRWRENRCRLCAYVVCVCVCTFVGNMAQMCNIQRRFTHRGKNTNLHRHFIYSSDNAMSAASVLTRFCIQNES